jgi:putative addiction module component (TIGR02574 family)
MPMTKEQILAEAMKLDPEDRVAVAEQLWLTLENEPDRELDAAWGEEAERRMAAYERGEVEAKPVDEVIERLLQKRRPA